MGGSAVTDPDEGVGFISGIFLDPLSFAQTINAESLSKCDHTKDDCLWIREFQRSCNSGDPSAPCSWSFGLQTHRSLQTSPGASRFSPYFECKMADRPTGQSAALCSPIKANGAVSTTLVTSVSKGIDEGSVLYFWLDNGEGPWYSIEVSRESRQCVAKDAENFSIPFPN